MSHEPISPTGEMITGADGLVEVCGTMLGLTLDRDKHWHPFDPQGMAYGGSIHLVHEEGSWEIGLFGNERTCANMAAAMLMMDEDEEPSAEEIVDALGELVNIVVGMLKTKIGGGEHGETQIGVPLFLLKEDCEKHRRRAIPLHSLALRSPDFDGQLMFVWSERSRANLLLEIAAWLETTTPDDKKALGHVRGLFDELHESVSHDADDSVWVAIEEATALVARVINDDAPDVGRVLDVLRNTLEALKPAFEPGAIGMVVPSPFATLEAEKPRSVARDDETIDMIREFLEEGEEGLDTADELLLGVEQSTDKTEAVHALFRVFHSIKGVSSFLDLEDISALGHHTEHLLSDIRDGKAALQGQNLELVFESTGIMRHLFGVTAAAVDEGRDVPRLPKVAEHLRRLEAAKRGEEVLPASAPKPAAEVPAPKVKRDKAPANVRVEAELLERLHHSLDAMRDLRPSIMASLAKDASPAAQELSEHLDVLLEVSTLMKMTSLEPVFQKMARMVRDLSKKTEKLAQLVSTSAHTKIERNIAEKVSEPLVHMIRNAVDHGLEAEAERRAAGKPLLGTVYLDAERRNAQVVIRIRDDGKGLDPQMILEKARAKGIVAQDAELEPAAIYQLIFEPGFSTAPVVTAISGRGVGMDVVRKNIQALGGWINVTSELGRGTTFELVLPSAPLRASDNDAPPAPSSQDAA